MTESFMLRHETAPWSSAASSNPAPHFTSSSLQATEAAPRRRGHRDFVFGRHEVSAARREILVSGALRTLQPRPFDLLVYLIEHRDRVVTTDELLDHIWKDEFVQPGSLAAAVMRIRKALHDSDHDAGTIIRTHQGIGYRFAAALDGDGAQDD